ncbi:hypothetical protein [Anaerosinus massiliensis]|uniref:hypothetical protein n=1 Tax=Massilibacillus massiliensis TaxID=1806837 RepID=UPI000DA61645|nr:hypothetical protein [Massilibacillus massiliensis]
MIKVNYDSVTGQILGFYPETIQYKSIPEPHIEINEATWKDCLKNQGERKVDIKTLQIIEYTSEPETTIKENETVDETTLAVMEALAAQEERIAKLEGSVKA